MNVDLQTLKILILVIASLLTNIMINMIKCT